MAEAKTDVTVRVETGMVGLPAGEVVTVERTKDVDKLLAAGRLIELDDKGDVVWHPEASPA